MDDLSPLPSTRDIRSPSIAHLRHASYRQKYGGRFMLSDPPNSLCRPLYVALGKPTTDLTPAEKLHVAHETVGRLIGKRVNRNNQRTGERDPWRYWGPGRRWAKREETGDLAAGNGLSVWQDEEEGRRQVGAPRSAIVLSKSVHGLDDHDRHERGVCVLAALDRSNLDAGDATSTVINTRNADEVVIYSVRISKQRPKRNRRQSEDQWEVVNANSSAEVGADDHDWDIVSICSAPG